MTSLSDEKPGTLDDCLLRPSGYDPFPEHLTCARTTGHVRRLRDLPSHHRNGGPTRSRGGPQLVYSSYARPFGVTRA